MNSTKSEPGVKCIIPSVHSTRGAPLKRTEAAIPQTKVKENSNDTHSMILAMKHLTYYYKVLLIVG